MNDFLFFYLCHYVCIEDAAFVPPRNKHQGTNGDYATSKGFELATRTARLEHSTGTCDLARSPS